MRPNTPEEHGPDARIGISEEQHGAGLRDTDGGRIRPEVAWMALLAVIVVLAAIALIVF
jgi:hypothetical protein